MFEKGYKSAALPQEKPTPDGCPCLIIEPCHPQCSCAKPFHSAGCSRCAKHGSLEQRKAKAESIAAALDGARATGTHRKLTDAESEEAARMLERLTRAGDPFALDRTIEAFRTPRATGEPK